MAGSGSRTVIYAALVGNTLIAATKLAASAMTGSAAMLSEGIHSLVDTGNQGLLLLGLKKASRPVDERHPFGHGKEVYFWSFVVAILIFAVGAGVSIVEGIRHIRHPAAHGSPTVNYVVLGLSFLFEGVAWFMAYREFRHEQGRRSLLRAVRESKDPTTFVVLFEDSAAMLGIIVAFLGVWLSHVTHIAWFDGAASVVIGLILGGTAVWLAHETKGLLIGESAAPEVADDVRRRALAQPEVQAVHEVLTLHMGPTHVLVTVSLDVADDVPTGRVEELVTGLVADVKGAWPRVRKVVIETADRAPASAE